MIIYKYLSDVCFQSYYIVTGTIRLLLMPVIRNEMCTDSDFSRMTLYQLQTSPISAASKAGQFNQVCYLHFGSLNFRMWQ